MGGLSIVHVIALVAGIAVVFLIRKRYTRISTTELAIIIILYVVLVLLFTDPIVDFILKKFQA